MSRNPFVNAGAAAGYIALVATVMYYLPRVASPIDSVVGPIAFLSLFVLSAAMMGYLFLFESARLFFENKQEEGTKLLLSTIAVFACITGALLLTFFYLGSKL